MNFIFLERETFNLFRGALPLLLSTVHDLEGPVFVYRDFVASRLSGSENIRRVDLTSVHAQVVSWIERFEQSAERRLEWVCDPVNGLIDVHAAARLTQDADWMSAKDSKSVIGLLRDWAGAETEVSPFIDDKEYYRKYIAGRGQEYSPLEHYIKIGARSGFFSGAPFDPDVYASIFEEWADCGSFAYLHCPDNVEYPLFFKTLFLEFSNLNFGQSMAWLEEILRGVDSRTKNVVVISEPLHFPNIMSSLSNEPCTALQMRSMMLSWSPDRTRVIENASHFSPMPVGVLHRWLLSQNDRISQKDALEYLTRGIEHSSPGQTNASRQGAIISSKRPLDVSQEPWNAAEALISGWSVIESTGVWSSGRFARLRLHLVDQPRGGVTIAIDYSAFLYGDVHPELQCTVRINRRVVDKWKIVQPSAQTKEISVSGTLMSDTVDLDFEFDKPESPARLGLNNDRRLLGIFLHAIKVLPVSSRDAASVANGIVDLRHRKTAERFAIGDWMFSDIEGLIASYNKKAHVLSAQPPESPNAKRVVLSLYVPDDGKGGCRLVANDGFEVAELETLGTWSTVAFDIPKVLNRSGRSIDIRFITSDRSEPRGGVKVAWLAITDRDRPLPAHPCNLVVDRTMDLSSSGNGEAFAVSGWYASEEHGRWTKRHEIAKLDIWPDRDIRTASFNLYAKPEIYEIEGNLEVGVIIDGSLHSVISYTDATFQSNSLVFERAPRFVGLPLTVGLQVMNPVPVQNVRQRADSRVLGLLVKNFRLTSL